MEKIAQALRPTLPQDGSIVHSGAACALVGSKSSNMKKMFGIPKFAYELIQIWCFNRRIPIFGSVDVTNRCNLKCKHCYWWQNREPQKELGSDDWRDVVRQNFIKKGVVSIALAGGEPLLRPDVIEAIIDEMGWRTVSIVTNGTLPLVDFGVGYFISIDGTETIHDTIRGMPVYKKVKQNVIGHPEADSVFINMTVNTLNHECVEDVVRDWHDYARGLTFQFHTPFSYDDKLWLPYGKLRDKTIDKMLEMKENYSDFIVNTSKQLNLFRDGKWTFNCPKWFFVNLDAGGRTKRSCVISNTSENGIEPICERCGLSCNAGAYSGLFLSDREWFRMFRIAKRTVPFKDKLSQG